MSGASLTRLEEESEFFKRRRGFIVDGGRTNRYEVLLGFMKWNVHDSVFVCGGGYVDTHDCVYLKPNRVDFFKNILYVSCNCVSVCKVVDHSSRDTRYSILRSKYIGLDLLIESSLINL